MRSVDRALEQIIGSVLENGECFHQGNRTSKYDFYYDMMKMCRAVCMKLCIMYIYNISVKGIYM